MFKIKNFIDNDDIDVIEENGPFKVVEYKRDLSVLPESAMKAYFSQEMNVRKKQLVCDLNESNVVLQKGAMQWCVGDVSANTGVKGVGDFFGKALKGSVTGEAALKPVYSGSGLLVTEPTYKHLIVFNTSEFNGEVVLDDGLFLACEEKLKNSVVMRSNMSSAIAGGEGLFNMTIIGDGYFVIESRTPRVELIEIELENDEIKIDGNLAVAWSKSLEFTVKKSGKSLIGSAASGEGLVNSYSGTGKIIISPVEKSFIDLEIEEEL